jgi:hypothetical protein
MEISLVLTQRIGRFPASLQFAAPHLSISIARGVAARVPLVVQ